MKIFKSCWSLPCLLQHMIMTGISSRNNETTSSVSILSISPALSFSVWRDCFLSVGQLLILFDLELPGQIREYRVQWRLQPESGKPRRMAGSAKRLRRDVNKYNNYYSINTETHMAGTDGLKQLQLSERSVWRHLRGKHSRLQILGDIRHHPRHHGVLLHSFTPSLLHFTIRTIRIGISSTILAKTSVVGSTSICVNIW